MTRDPSEEQWRQIDAELYAGRKIHAIRPHRQVTGSQLKDSKEMVDSREAALRSEHPAAFQTPPRSGCLSVMLLAAIAILFATLL
jgi:hypothetical protein